MEYGVDICQLAHVSFLPSLWTIACLPDSTHSNPYSIRSQANLYRPPHAQHSRIQCDEVCISIPIPDRTLYRIPSARRQRDDREPSHSKKAGRPRALDFADAHVSYSSIIITSNPFAA